MIGKIVSFLTLVLMFATVSAQPSLPPFPAAFYGTVSIGGNPAPVGTDITAKIDGVERGSITTTEAGLYGGPGGLDPKLVINGNSSDEGKTILFFIGDYEADQTAEWHSGNITELNLTFPAFCGDNYCNNGETCSSCSQDCGTCPPTGGNVPSGGGAYTPPCTPNWTCSEWSICINSEQARTCTDLNNCGTIKNKPAEKQNCTPELPKTCTPGQKICSGDNIMECNDNDWVVTKSCEFGCSAGKCLTGQQNQGASQEPVKKEEVQRNAPQNPITGLYLNPATIYVGFLIILFVMAGALVLKFH